jgi:hypothetical protein
MKKEFVRSFLVVGKIQNTKLVEFPVLYFVFCRSRSGIVVVDRRQNRLEICVFNFVAFFCHTTKHEIETKFTHNFVVLSCFVTRQNTKYKTRNSTSFVFCILSTTRNDLNSR